MATLGELIGCACGLASYFAGLDLIEICTDKQPFVNLSCQVAQCTEDCQFTTLAPGCAHEHHSGTGLGEWVQEEL